MPESRSGRRRASVWKTKASISIPKPAMAQAIMAARPPLTRPNAPGRAKIPEPTIEPMTRAVSARSDSFCSVDAVMIYSSRRSPATRSELLAQLHHQIERLEPRAFAIGEAIEIGRLPFERPAVRERALRRQHQARDHVVA